MASVYEGSLLPLLSDTSATGVEEGAWFVAYTMHTDAQPPLRLIARPSKGTSILRVYLSRTVEKPNKAHSDFGGSGKGGFTVVDVPDAVPGATYFISVKSMDKVDFTLHVRNGAWRELAREDDSAASRCSKDPECRAMN